MCRQILKNILIVCLVFFICSCTFYFGDSIGGDFSHYYNFSQGYDPHDVMAREIQIELNRARYNPQSYANEVLLPSLARYKGYIYTNYAGEKVRTEEGISCMKSLIEELRLSSSSSILKMEKGLYLAARHLSDEQAITGATGGKTRTGLDVEDRQKRYGVIVGLSGEARAYGAKNARDVVIALLLDDGNFLRKNRRMVLNTAFKKVGVGFAVSLFSHNGAVAVIDMTEDYISD